MPGALFDTNIWLAAVFTTQPLHALAQNALQRATPVEPAVFCRATEQSFLRLASTPALLKIYGAEGLTNRDALSTRLMTALDISASMSIKISMRSPTLAMPVTKPVYTVVCISGAGLIKSWLSSSTSDTKSTTGTITPRRLTAPLMKLGALAPAPQREWR